MAPAILMSRRPPRPVAAPAVVAPGDGERRWDGDRLVDLRLLGRHTGDRVSLIELHLPAGAATLLHRHLYDDETIYLLEGRLIVHADGVDEVAEAGAIVFVPRECPHALRAEAACRMLVFGEPDGQERYLRAVSVPASAPIPPPADPAPHPLAAIARQQTAALNGVEVLGDAPFG